MNNNDIKYNNPNANHINSIPNINNSNNNNNIHTVTIESIDLEGKGVTHIEGKTVFIDGALPDEVARIEIYKKKPNFDKARLIELITPSPHRITPECPNFGVCGGCSMQHLDFESQIHNKQKALLDNLKYIGQVTPLSVIPPLLGKPFAYRHRARLSVRHVAKKGGVLVGFHEKSSSFVADMNQCLILPNPISNLIPTLKTVIGKLSIYNKIPQIEVAVGDKVNVLVFRIMESLTSADELILQSFVDEHNAIMNNPLQLWLQPKGPDTCYPFYPLNAPKLDYILPQFDIEMPYLPTEFTQVNPTINAEMINLAISHLNPQSNEVIADFFCGIGNFTLPIAKYAKSVIGIEGSEQLVKRAQENAKHNNLENKTNYLAVNLFKIDSNWLNTLNKMATIPEISKTVSLVANKIDKWLIDPPRDGAAELISAITPDTAPSKIVYISCNPATLARDASVLVNVHGYTLTDAGVMNMFPHTSHVESIAVFEKTF
ncbi:MAG: rRNA (uracil1939-C5)-methyltransferase [Pseudomonadota bacterium]|nr:rRNA (uracil1939-C5)-methyltransferase [Pseudomonadota bacterium]